MILLTKFGRIVWHWSGVNLLIGNQIAIDSLQSVSEFVFISLVYLQSYHIFLSGLTVEVGLNDGRMQRDVFSPANPQLQRAERTMIFLDLHVCVSI